MLKLILGGILFVLSHSLLGQKKPHFLYFSVVQRENHPTYGQQTSEIGVYRGDWEKNKWQHLAWKNNFVWGITLDTLSAKKSIYLACSNGVMKSENDGLTWKIISNHLLKEILKVYFSPRNPKVLYACTAYGLWRSFDEGNNWSKIDFKQKKIGYNFIRCLFIHPSDTNLYLAGTAEGLLISEDGTKTWGGNQKIHTEIHTIQSNPHNSSQIVCATEKGIYWSVDKGLNWQTAHNQALTNPIYTVTFDTQQKDRMYCGGFQSGLYVSDNLGENWILLDNNLKSKTIHSIAIHPIHPEIIAVGTLEDGLFISNDKGISFKNVEISRGKVWQVLFE